MRKNDVRKWLHAILDLLPVLVIPVFALAVRSDNNFNPIEVEAVENKVVTFNQQVENGNFVDFEGWHRSNLSASVSNNVAYLSGDIDNVASIYRSYSNFYTSHIYYVKFDYVINTRGNVQSLGLRYPTYLSGFSENVTSKVLGALYTYERRFTLNSVSSQSIQFQIWVSGTSSPFDIELSNFQLFDLTLMYGSGNEPSIEEFNLHFTESYYQFNSLGTKQLIKNYNSIQLSDTDIGSQFVYTLYKTTDKYFNLNNIFGFGNVWDWMLLNIFNGNAPLAVYVVWQIVLYEFVMDLIFLIYGLFMFFIDSCTNLMERFNCQLRGK